ncbi:MAG: cysteine desulfurase [Balneolaceae bacterium]|nr:cysteine desulfurase [Balneolaceae bacterium]
MAKTAGTKTDFEKVRKDFPVLGRNVNGKPLVYLDNAASSQMPEAVSRRIDRYHRTEHANVHRGIHTLSQQATDAFEETREKVRRFINAGSTKEIIYTSGTTESINLVAHSYGNAFFEKGSEIVISEVEHHANIVPWQIMGKQTGCRLRIIPVNDRGELLFDEYIKLLNEKTALVAVGHVSNALGTVHPVEEIIEEAHDRGIPVLIDGAQAAPHSVVDVQELDCDFYAFSAHKMCGPTAIGILYGKERLLEKMDPYRGGGEMIDEVSFEETTFERLPFKFEPGTPPIASVIGFGTAIDYLNAIGMDRIAAREQELLAYATEKLDAIDGLTIIGNAKEKASVISFVLDGIHPSDIGTILDQQGIAIRTGHHCAQPTMKRFNVPATARASISFYNNEEDIDRLADGIKQVQKFF